MKITTRVTTAFTLLIALPAALIVFQVFALRRMQAESDNPSSAGFHSALAALQLISDQARVDEYTRGFFAANPPGGKNELRSYQEDFDAGLRSIKAAELSEREQTEVERLDKF